MELVTIVSFGIWGTKFPKYSTAFKTSSKAESSIEWRWQSAERGGTGHYTEKGVHGHESSTAIVAISQLLRGEAYDSEVWLAFIVVSSETLTSFSQIQLKGIRFYEVGPREDGKSRGRDVAIQVTTQEKVVRNHDYSR